MASIYDIKCPNCKKAVWFNNGNESDLTTPDVEALSCPFCQTCFWLDPDDDMFREDRKPEDCAEEGHKTPNEAAGLA
jgi:hypothetical protein